MKAKIGNIIQDSTTGMLVLPRGTQSWSLSIAKWDEWADVLRKFVQLELAESEVQPDVAPDSRTHKIIRALVALVPEPSNKFNPEAITVCPAPRFGQDSVGRPFGYMRESYLWRYSRALHELHDLARVAIGCHAWVELHTRDEEDPLLYVANPPTSCRGAKEIEWRIGQVRLNLPPSSEVKVLAEQYAKQYSNTGSVRFEQGAEIDQSQWERFSRSKHPHGALRMERRRVFDRVEISLITESGVKIGRYFPKERLVTLLDERARADAIDAFKKHGIRAKRSLADEGLDNFANVTISVEYPLWTVRKLLNNVPVHSLPILAQYDPDSQVVTVWARAHAEMVRQTLLRHGCPVREIKWATPPYDVRIHNDRVRPLLGSGTDPREPVRLLPAAQHLVPSEYGETLDVRWEHAPPLSERDEARIPSYSSLGERAPCRLCGMPAYSDAAARLFCEECTQWAFRGRLQDTGLDGPWTEATVYALRRLSEIEFSGPPSRSQLSLFPQADIDRVNEAMLLRFFVPRRSAQFVNADRGVRTWHDWLLLAGLLDDVHREGRGIRTIASDGHPCRSMFERHIDDFMYHHGIDHSLEPPYPFHPELNPRGLRADWLLSDGTFVEALGMMDDATYAERFSRKAALASGAGLKLLTIFPNDLNRLSSVFASWLSE